MTGKPLTKVRFVATIAKMGDKKVIIVPKDYYDEVDKLKPKQVRVTIDDEL